MNVYFYSVALLVISSFICTEGIFSGGTVVVSAGGLFLAAALGIKAIAGIGLLASSKRRGGSSRGRGHSHHRRSAPDTNDISAILSEASLEDEGDCAKKYVCEVHAKALSALDETEMAIYHLFESGETVDVSRDTVQFDLAAAVGRLAGFEQCQKVYARCEMDNDQLKNALK